MISVWLETSSCKWGFKLFFFRDSRNGLHPAPEGAGLDVGAKIRRRLVYTQHLRVPDFQTHLKSSFLGAQGFTGRGAMYA